MQNANDIKLIQAVICDDVRYENNGKFILIGVYSNGIFVNTLPLEIPMSMWIQFELNLKNKTTLEFAVNGKSLNGEVSFSQPIDSENIIGKKQIVPFVAKFPLKIKEAGSFSVFYREMGAGEWSLINEFTINKNMVN